MSNTTGGFKQEYIFSKFKETILPPLPIIPDDIFIT